MKISIEAYGKIHTTEIDHDDVNIDDYIDIFYGLLVCLTFSEQTIINGLTEFLEDKQFNS